MSSGIPPNGDMVNDNVKLERLGNYYVSSFGEEKISYGIGASHLIMNGKGGIKCHGGMMYFPHYLG